MNLPVLSEQVEEVGKPLEKPNGLRGMPYLLGVKSLVTSFQRTNGSFQTFPQSKDWYRLGAGHWLHADNPSEFYEKIMNFWQDFPEIRVTNTCNMQTILKILLTRCSGHAFGLYTSRSWGWKLLVRHHCSCCISPFTPYRETHFGVLTFPITIVTLGLFLLVINAFIIQMADYFISGFAVRNFWWALLFSILLYVFAIRPLFSTGKRSFTIEIHRGITCPSATKHYFCSQFLRIPNEHHEKDIDNLNAVLTVEISKERLCASGWKVLTNYRKMPIFLVFVRTNPHGNGKKAVWKGRFGRGSEQVVWDKLHKYLTEEKLDILGNPLPKMKPLSIGMPMISLLSLSWAWRPISK